MNKCTKINEKSTTICPKSVPEAVWEGSGGHLGPQGTPREPKGPKNSKKVSRRPPPRAQVGDQNRQKIFPERPKSRKRAIFSRFAFRTVFLTIFGALRLPPGDHKSSKTFGGLFKNKVRTAKEKVGSEKGPGLPFGVVLAPFSADFGPPEPKSLKKSRKKSIQKKHKKKDA